MDQVRDDDLKKSRAPFPAFLRTEILTSKRGYLLCNLNNVKAPVFHREKRAPEQGSQPKTGTINQQEEHAMSEGVVYSFGFTDVAPHIIGARPLDGNVRKIEYIDTSVDPGLSPLFEPGDLYAGRAVKPENIPTRVQWQSKSYKPYDVFMSGGLILVSDAFKDIIENHEPGVHQFFPIEVVYRDGTFARQMYFFNICNRLDTMDRDRATAKFQNVSFDPRTGAFVFSLEKIGSAHAWIDKHVHPGRFLSSAVVDGIKQAGLTGIAFHSYPAF